MDLTHVVENEQSEHQVELKKWGIVGYEMFESSEGLVEVSFNLSSFVSMQMFELIEFMDNLELPYSYVVCDYDQLILDRECMRLMEPQKRVRPEIISAYARIMTFMERKKYEDDSSPLVWFMPAKISQKQFGPKKPIRRVAFAEMWKEVAIINLKKGHH